MRILEEAFPKGGGGQRQRPGRRCEAPVVPTPPVHLRDVFTTPGSLQVPSRVGHTSTEAK